MHLHWTKSAVLSMLCVRATRSPPTLIASYGKARGPQAAQLRRHPPIQRPAPLLNLHQSIRSSENRTTRTDASTEGSPSIRRRRRASFTTRSAWILYAAARVVSPNSKSPRSARCVSYYGAGRGEGDHVVLSIPTVGACTLFVNTQCFAKARPARQCKHAWPAY